jgi:hypothetical protein
LELEREALAAVNAGSFKCELWVIDGKSELRLYDVDRLRRMETLTSGDPYGYERLTD